MSNSVFDFYSVLNLLGIEAFAFGVTALIVIRWHTKLIKHLDASNRRFLEDNFSAPFWAGDWSTVQQHRVAIRNAYFGKMPDEQSRCFQSRLRVFASIAMLFLVSFAVTLIVGVIIGSR